MPESFWWISVKCTIEVTPLQLKLPTLVNLWITPQEVMENFVLIMQQLVVYDVNREPFMMSFE